MKSILYIGNNLSKSGKTVTTIETLTKRLRFEGYTVYTASKKNNKIMRLLDMLFSIVKHSKKTDYVFIDTYSTSNFYYAFLCSQLCRILKLKYLPILHGGNLPNRLKRNPQLCNQIFKNAYKNIAPSPYMMSIFNDFGYDNLLYIPNIIDIKNYLFKKRTFDKVHLLWVRSFSEIYNPLLAIKVLKSLLDKGIESSLCMVGPDNDGSLQKTKNYAKELNVKVTFTGKLTKQEWIGLSQDYNFFINTTNIDNMPVSVIEAMALGLPIISTNVGGIPFLIENEEDGVLVNPNAPHLFVKAIERLQSNPKLANEIVLSARKKVEQYDWELVKKQWLSVLR